jgi:hypothetical protein
MRGKITMAQISVSKVQKLTRNAAAFLAEGHARENVVAVQVVVKVGVPGPGVRAGLWL